MLAGAEAGVGGVTGCGVGVSAAAFVAGAVVAGADGLAAALAGVSFGLCNGWAGFGGGAMFAATGAGAGGLGCVSHTVMVSFGGSSGSAFGALSR